MPRGNEKQIGVLRNWVDENVQIAGEIYATMNEKVDLLERILEFIRIADKRLDNELPFDKALNWRYATLDDEIVCLRPGGKRSLQSWGKGTSQDKLQVRLLVYLLKTMNQKSSVYSLVEGFVKEQWDDLEAVDFQKTRTGVYRCYTNTRFAAMTLRRYGLLRYTQKEAFKTWKLSLPGVLTAAEALKHGELLNGPFPHSQGSSIHPWIFNYGDQFKSFDLILQSLKLICPDNIEVFDSFEPVLQKAGALLPCYWRKFLESKGEKSKKQLTSEIIAQLESIEGYGDFMNELAECIEIERILEDSLE